MLQNLDESVQQPSSPENEEEQRPLVLHIRALRQWYAGRSLTQDELAQLAGITRSQLYRLETARHAPRMLEELHAIALALRVPMEDLIAPQWREDHEAIIEDRRRAMGLSYPATHGFEFRP